MQVIHLLSRAILRISIFLFCIVFLNSIIPWVSLPEISFSQLFTSPLEDSFLNFTTYIKNNSHLTILIQTFIFSASLRIAITSTPHFEKDIDAFVDFFRSNRNDA